MKKLMIIALGLACGAVAQAATNRNDFLGAEYGDYGSGATRSVQSGGGGALMISLAGDWRCELDPDRKGDTERWFTRDLPLPIRLPATLDEAGYGPRQDKRLLRTLTRHVEYIGPAWYQRTVEIPAEWEGKRLTLTLERVMWESRLWVDDQPVGARDSLATPHRYDLTGLLKPGKHRLTVRVDNSGRPGASCHGYGDDMQTRWNGLLGRLELKAQDVVHIRGVQVYPEPARKRAIVRVSVGSLAGGSVDGTVTVTARLKGDAVAAWLPPVKANFKLAGEPLPLELALPLGESPAYWDEFTPVLYEVKVEVAADLGKRKSFDRELATFGLRDVSHRGTQLTINGKTVFLRGTHDGANFPLTGYPVPDVEAWRRIFRTCKAYGLNHVRYHSFCPPEAAFAAADEEGFYLLAELPYWGNVSADGPGTAFLRAELIRILDAYGNHPSFVMMSMGNEHSGDWDVLARFVEVGKRHDPRHRYAAASNEYIRMGRDPRPVGEGDEFAAIMRGPVSPPEPEAGRIRLMEHMLHGRPVDFGGDYRDIVKQFDQPVFAHELGQWWVFPDPAEAAKYKGVVRSGAMELFRDSLATAGLLDHAKTFQQASGALAVLLYKEDIERELRTPGLGGFQLLDLRDYSGQNTSLVGILDVFWDSKGLITPEAFRRFCSPTVVLARMPQRVWMNSETLKAQVEVAHYGAKDLEDVTPSWKLTAVDGRVLASGSLARQVRIATGTNTVLGEIAIPLGAMTQPVQLDLEVACGAAVNDWPVWVYPREDSRLQTSGHRPQVRSVETLDDATWRFIENGGRVLYLGHRSLHTVPVDFPNSIWNPFGGNIQSCGLVVSNTHPALAAFPTERHSNWQWRELLEPDARAFVLSDLPAGQEPIVTVIDQPLRAFRLGTLWEAKVGQGVLLATSMDLVSELDRRVSARQLRRSLEAYLASDACRPTLALSAQEAAAVALGSRLALVDGVPATARVKLEVEPSANVKAEEESAWKPACDRLVKETDGFGYSIPVGRYNPWNAVPNVCWRKRGTVSWMGRCFEIRVKVPAGFGGMIYVQFRDQDSGKASGFMEYGRDACNVGPHGGAGKWVAVRVAPEDIRDGAVELHIGKPAGGDTWSGSPRVTRLVVAENRE